MRIAKKISFVAGHRLMHHAGRCRSLHGHNYELEIVLEGSVVAEGSSAGMVADFAALRPLRDWIDRNLDHVMILYRADPLCTLYTPGGPCGGLASFFMDDHPTAEGIATLIAGVTLALLPFEASSVRLHSVVVWETPTCSATWSAGDPS